MSLLLLTILIGVHGFEIPDQTDLEWVAPGYQIEEIVINPYDYVQSIGETTPSVACYVFFPNPEEDFWRIIIVGKDKLVVLQEDWESPFELNLPFDAVGAVFSRSGKYVIIREGTYTNDQAIRVNIETGEVTYFDPTPDNIQCGLLLADDGAVLGVLNNGFVDFSDDLYSADILEYDNLSARHIGYSADCRIIVLENVKDRPREIMAFDRDGMNLWSIDIGEISVSSWITVSSSGNYALVPSTSDGIKLIDATSGDILTDILPGCQSAFTCMTVDGFHLAIASALSPGTRPNDLILATLESLHRSDSRKEYIAETGWAYTPVGISSDGDCLLSISQTGPPGGSRLGLINNNGEVIWYSKYWDRLFNVFSISPNFYNLDINLRSIIRELAPGGSCLIYMDKCTGNIHIVSLIDEV